MNNYTVISNKILTFWFSQLSRSQLIQLGIILFLIFGWSCKTSPASDLENIEDEEIIVDCESGITDLVCESFGENTYGGVYGIWGNPDKMYALDFVKGGQVAMQWKWIHKGPGEFDFAALDERMGNLVAKNIKFTVQVNGNQKPDFLFDNVPYLPKSITVSHQVEDPLGTLMYWHPYYKKMQEEYITAIGEHLENYAYKDYIIGFRTTYNGAGTEHWIGEEDFKSQEDWVIPEGVTYYDINGGENIGTKERIDGYYRAALPTIVRFVRNMEPWNYPEIEQQAFDEGKAAPYQTGSDMQPYWNGTGVEWRFASLIKWGRGGYTKTYSEQGAASEGVHGSDGSQQAFRWATPAQWLYWHCLFELHLGTSYVAIYATDLYKASEDCNFASSLHFVNKYAGYHDKPATSPGAWIAFREGDRGRYNEQNPDWDMRKDYTFLVDRWVDSEDFPSMSIEKEKDGTPKFNYVVPSELGDQTQKYGAWGRKLLKGKNINIEFNQDFINSISGQEVIVKVTYLNKEGAYLDVSAFGETETIGVCANDRWATYAFRLSGADSNIVNLTAVDGDVILHMVEIERVLN